MLYCTLEDAWGDKYITNNRTNNIDTTTNNTNNLLNNTTNNTNSLLNNTTNNKNLNTNNFNNKNNIEQFENNYNNLEQLYNKTLTCDDYIYHVKNCKICQNKIKNFLRPNIIDNLYIAIDNNKDIIILILIGISILLFFNLIINITK